MWTQTRFEKHVEARLKAEHSGTTLWSSYEVTRTKLLDAIYGEIKGANRDLSDHGAEHIADVQANTLDLLSESEDHHGLNGVELFCLAIAILFHDVGNLYDRVDHQNRIGAIYDWARGTEAALRREKTLITNVVRAHTGKAADGTFDTLKELSETDHVHSATVRPRTLGAILRFADELSEGPKRTSEFRRLQGLINPNSAVYHDYASVTHVKADRGNARVLLTYEIVVTPDAPVTTPPRLAGCSALLSFVYERIIKLDQERRYARYYCNVLEAFKSTTVAINFHHNSRVLNLDLPPIALDDKVVPGDRTRSIAELDGRYDVTKVETQLLRHMTPEAK